MAFDLLHSIQHVPRTYLCQASRHEGAGIDIMHIAQRGRGTNNGVPHLYSIDARDRLYLPHAEEPIPDVSNATRAIASTSKPH